MKPVHSWSKQAKKARAIRRGRVLADTTDSRVGLGQSGNAHQGRLAWRASRRGAQK
jgi:hypothetical protein